MKNMVTDQIVLPPSKENDNRKTLILDLDETLVHSSFSPVDNCDLILPVRFFKLRLK
jgi:TFIIF-interacting CTD phosphatase-like protein